MPDVPEFISLNGPDNVGKTTQLRRLARRSPLLQPLGAVHEHDPERWERVAGPGYARWWFETSTTKELTGMLLAGHTNRAAAREQGRVGLLDRGLPMLLAVSAATCALKESLDVSAALKRVTGLAAAASPPETALLLLPSMDPDIAYALTSAREGRPWTGSYPAYQRLLHQTLVRQAELGTYHAIVVCEDRSVEEIHDELVRQLPHALPVSVPAEGDPS
ncbi:hypothetical protein [Streptomyces sp. YIM 98790]|uniref:hypothetical protein n=1 Tax=Streptomyces sp. YIM 98790 TaxID=2689077 RepID=UPI00140E5703|nr:hypothetical protein [Streptomyces sp. YIM 98790]